jgi:hypothetical protein
MTDLNTLLEVKNRLLDLPKNSLPWVARAVAFSYALGFTLGQVVHQTNDNLARHFRQLLLKN